MVLIEIIGVVLFLAVVFFILSFEIKSFLSWIHRKPVPPKRISFFVHTLFFLGTALFFYAFFIEPYWLEVKNIDIVTKKLKKTDFTIVQISDLHCDLSVRNEDKIVQIVNKIDPDIIVFTGDAINTREALPKFKWVLTNLKARLGKVAVKGNWDVWYWSGLDLFGGTGFRELNGDTEIFFKSGNKIAVVGFNPDQQIDVPQIFYKITPNIYTLLLFHYPGIHEELGDVPVDLFLAGHVHGGQVALPFYGAVVTLSKYGKKYESGLYKLTGDKMLYVSRGVGMEGGFIPRIRFLSRPEITVFHIRPEK